MDDLIKRYVRQTGGMFMPDIVRAIEDHGHKESEIRRAAMRMINHGELIFDYDRKIRVPKAGNEISKENA